MVKKLTQRKHAPSEAELQNDPSLRYTPYRSGELVYSDDHEQVMRFLEYAGDKIRLATVNALTPLSTLVKKLSVRRS